MDEMGHTRCSVLTPDVTEPRQQAPPPRSSSQLMKAALRRDAHYRMFRQQVVLVAGESYPYVIGSLSSTFSSHQHCSALLLLLLEGLSNARSVSEEDNSA